MALGMRHWIGLTLAGGALIALRLLPPSELELPTPEAPTQEAVYSQALQADAWRANARLQRLELAEAAIPATLAAEGPLYLRVPEGADPSDVQEVGTRAAAAAAEARRGGADVALGLFYLSSREFGNPNAPSVRMSQEYYFGEREGRAYCVATASVWRMARDRRIRLTGIYGSRVGLEVCELVARYGLPGDAVRRWLEQGGTAMAATLEPSDPAKFSFSTRLGVLFERRGLLGIPFRSGPSGYVWPRTLAREQCLAGLAEGCAALFLWPGGDPRGYWGIGFVYRAGPDFRELFGSTPLSAVQGESLLEPADRHVAADLVSEFGEDRFRRFWTAGGATDVAFQDAFGVDPGTWYARRVAKLVTISEPGPGVAWNGALGALALLALGTLAGSAWARRRSVA